jgi:hypothetical protein
MTKLVGGSFTIPHLNFQGTPTGIDIRRAVETGITPVINTGIAHRKPGLEMVGAGMVGIPAECFIQALEAFLESIESAGDLGQVILLHPTRPVLPPRTKPCRERRRGTGRAE